MYAKTKANLPHAQRMENITWRMMALALKKKKEEEDLAASGQQGDDAQDSAIAKTSPQDRREEGSSQVGSRLTAEAEGAESDERGRRIDKGKARVRVVGFDGTNQDGAEENESVYPFRRRLMILKSFPFFLAPSQWIGVR